MPPWSFQSRRGANLEDEFFKKSTSTLFSLFQHIYVVCSTIFWILVPDLQDEKPLVVSLK